MERQSVAENKDIQIDSLTPQEIDCIKEVVIPEYYQGIEMIFGSQKILILDLNVDGIRQKLVRQLLKHEKDSIYVISQSRHLP